MYVTANCNAGVVSMKIPETFSKTLSVAHNIQQDGDIGFVVLFFLKRSRGYNNFDFIIFF